MRYGRWSWTLFCLVMIATALGHPRYGAAAWRFSVLPDQWSGEPVPAPSVQVPNPISRDLEVQKASLKEAIGLALENNPRIHARRLEPARQAAGVLRAEGQYDPVLGLDLLSTTSETPAGSQLSGNSVVKTNDRSANLQLQKLLRSGGSLKLDFLNDRLDTNSSFQALRPQYKPSLGFSVVQPLLRNLGWNYSYLVVRVAEEQQDASVYQYQADLTDFVQEVIQDYWAVVGFREAVAVQQKSLELANRTVEENSARVNVGLLAPVSVLEAQADAKSREADLLVAQNNLAIARQRLSQVVFFRPLDSFVPRSIEPIDDVALDGVKPDLDDSLAIALAERPEIEASKRGVKVAQLNERIASNQLLPRLDLVGSYGVNSLSGTTSTQTVNILETDTAEISRLRARGCSCANSPCLLPRDQCPLTGSPVTCTCPTSVPRSAYGGSLGNAYDRLNGDFFTYSFGIQLEVPFANATAEGNATQSRIARDQAELTHRELLSQITLEVRQAVSDVQTARQRVDATRVARQLAEENLRNQEQRHSVGAATTKDLLDFQSRLTAAGFAEVQAKVDYATATARWRRSQGRLLDHYQIVFERPGEHSPSWFARF